MPGGKWRTPKCQVNEPPGQGIDFTVEGIMNLSTATWFLSLFSFTPLTHKTNPRHQISVFIEFECVPRVMSEVVFGMRLSLYLFRGAYNFLSHGHTSWFHGLTACPSLSLSFTGGERITYQWELLSGIFLILSFPFWNARQMREQELRKE